MSKAAKMIRQHEGVKRFPYFCPANQLTVGAGRNIQAIPFSDDEIDLMLSNDIKRVTEELESRFEWFSDIKGARRDAIICICFNLGISRLLKFNRALSSMSKGNWSDAAYHFMDSKWAKQVKQRANQLTQMIKTNEY